MNPQVPLWNRSWMWPQRCVVSLIPQAAAGARASGVWWGGAELGFARDNTLGQQEPHSVS